MPKFPTLPRGPNTELTIGDFVERVPRAGNVWLAHAERPLLLVAPEDVNRKRLEIWDLARGARLMKLSRGNQSPSWDSTGARVAIGCTQTRVYDTTTGRLLGSFESPKPPPPKPKPRPKRRRGGSAIGGYGGGGTGYGVGGLGRGGGAAGIAGFGSLAGPPARSIAHDACSAFVGSDRLLTIDARGSHVWSLKTGKRLLTAKTPNASQHSVASDPQGKTLAMLGHGVLTLYDARTLRKLRDMKLKADSVALSPDGKQLALGGERDVKIVDAAKLEVQHEVELPSSLDERPVAYSSDGMTLFTLGAGQLRRIDAASGSLEPARKLVFEAPVGALGTLPEKGLLVSASGSRIEFWDAKDGSKKGSWQLDAAVNDLVVPRGGESIVAVQGTALSHFSTADLSQAKALKQIALPRALISGERLTSSPDGKLIGVPGAGVFALPGLIREAPAVTDPAAFLDAASVLTRMGHDVLAQKLDGSSSDFRADFRTQDVERVAASKLGWVVGSANGSVRMWQRRSGELLRSFTAHYVDLSQLVVSPDGKLLATASRNEVRVWDLRTGLAVFAEERGGEVTSVAFTHDSARLLCAGDDRTLSIHRIPEVIEEPSPPKIPTQDGDRACQREYSRLERLAEAKKKPATAGVLGASSGIYGALSSDLGSLGGLGGLGAFGGGKGHYEKDRALSPRKLREVTWKKLGLGRDFRCGLTSGGLVLCSDGFGAGESRNSQHWGPDDLAVLGVGDAKQLAVGEDFACARLGDGEVRCWGRSKLVDGGGERIRAEALKVALPGKAKQLEAGPRHACAALDDGSVWCWGEGGSGQLGNGERRDVESPVQVCGLKDVESLALTAHASCAIVGNGEVSCWGDRDGEESTSVPVEVEGLSGVTSLAAGSDHLCALTRGRVQCWGEGAQGQLGNGKKESSPRPQPVDLRRSSKAQKVTAVYAGGHRSCAGFADGRLACWGKGDEGQLGDGRGKSSSRPVLVAGLSGVADVATQGDRSCALAEGELSCWGLLSQKWVWDEEPKPLFGDSYGSRSKPTPPKVSEIWGQKLLPTPGPQRQPLFDGANGFFTSFSGICALVPSAESDSSGIGGEVRCQGYDTAFEEVFGGVNPKAIKRGTAGLRGKCLVEATGQVTCESGYPAKWGRVPGITKAVDVAVGYEMACAALQDGRVACWNRAYDEKTPPQVEVQQGLSGAVRIASGESREFCALTRQRDAICWGGVQYDDEDPKPATPSTWQSDVVDLVGAEGGLCVVRHDGAVACRSGRYTNRLDAPPVVGVKALSLSAGHGCALLQSGEISCWGSNEEGQLGRGRTSRPFAAVVEGLPKMKQVIAGRGSTCALDDEGKAWCWGAISD